MTISANPLPSPENSNIYNEAYYKSYGGTPYERSSIWTTFFRSVAKQIVEQFAPKTVLDAGCAFGMLVEALRELGVDAEGFDISDYAMSQVPDPLAPYVWEADIADRYATTKHYDLVVCIEILEHLSQPDGDLAIANLCQWGERILFSSTPLDFTEKTHINVQQPSYWVERFAQHDWVVAAGIDATFLSHWAMVLERRNGSLPELLGQARDDWWTLRQQFDAVQSELLEQRRLTQEAQAQQDAIRRDEKDKRIKLYTALASQIDNLSEQVQSQQSADYLAAAQLASQRLEILEQQARMATQVIGANESEFRSLQEQLKFRTLELTTESERRLSLEMRLLRLESTPLWRAYEQWTALWQALVSRLFPPETRREHAYMLVNTAMGILFSRGPRALLERQYLWLRGERRYYRSPSQHAAQAISVSNGMSEPDEHETFTVLFVGPQPEIASKRYRIANVREQLAKCNVSTQSIDEQEFLRQVDFGSQFDIVVLSRITYDPRMNRFLENARAQNTRVVFEIDDYIFDTDIIHHFEAAQTSKSWGELKLLTDGIKGYREMLCRCDYFIGSTSYITNAARALGRTGYTIRNGLNDRQLALAAEVRAQPKPEQPLRIGYLSGSATHTRDFAVVLPAIIRIMAEFPDVHLVIQGLLDVPAELMVYAARIERRPFVTWEKLVADTATLDINLAPLEINPFTAGKSALKYFEAALVGVPTIASPIEDFLIAIQHMETGLIAYQHEDWYTSLRLLISDADLRHTMGKRAYHDAIERYTSDAQRVHTLNVFHHILRGEYLPENM